MVKIRYVKKFEKSLVDKGNCQKSTGFHVFGLILAVPSAAGLFCETLLHMVGSSDKDSLSAWIVFLVTLLFGYALIEISRIYDAKADLTWETAEAGFPIKRATISCIEQRYNLTDDDNHSDLLGLIVAVVDEDGVMRLLPAYPGQLEGLSIGSEIYIYEVSGRWLIETRRNYAKNH